MNKCTNFKETNEKKIKRELWKLRRQNTEIHKDIDDAVAYNCNQLAADYQTRYDSNLKAIEKLEALLNAEIDINLDNHAEIKIHGLKCDTVSCDWSDMSIQFEDYKLYVDKACPKCNNNSIMTSEEFQELQSLYQAVDKVNQLSDADIENFEQLSEEEKLEFARRLLS